MRARKLFRTVETHTLGQPTRNVVSGFRRIPGNTMAEKYSYMREHEDWFRKLLSHEPRGSEIMSGTLITDPCTPGTDVGVLYFESSGWMPMCGHDTIGVTVALIESGLVEVTEPITTIHLDTAAGVVKVEAEVEDGVVDSVSFLNAPALVLKKDVTVDTREYGTLTVDIAWGGNVYAILPAESVGTMIEPKNCGRLIEIAQSIGKDINEQIEIQHPELPFVDRVTHIEFSAISENGESDILNCVVALPRVVDRSPCGTGTSARAAVLFAEGKLTVGDAFNHESIIGSVFKCEIAEELEVGGQLAIRPRVTGNACVIGFATWVLDPKDPFPEGFVLDY